jgi:iron complex transport system substrate-binding protein
MKSARPTFARVLVAGLTLTVIAGACGDDPTERVNPTAPSAIETDESDGPNPTGTTTPAPEFPAFVEYGGTGVEIASEPRAIVSLSPTATEMLFAIGAGDQVDAADAFSNYPAEAPTTDLDGNSPNVEALLGYEPDLVVVSFDPGDVVTGLASAGVPTLVLPSAVSLDDTYEQIAVLGDATGHAAEAEALNASIATDIADLVSSIPERDDRLTYYHELDDTLYSITSSTFIGELYGLVGLDSIADPADADGAAGGYPQLSAEYVVEADPDVIFLADSQCCAQTPETIAGRPGWGDLQAIRSGNVVELDEDIASRWGPRVVDFLRVIVDAVDDFDTGA